MARTILVILAVTVCLASALSTPKIRGSWPIKRNTSPQLGKYDHGSLVGAIGVGDVADSAYSVDVQIGNDTFPLVMDTGSSDLLVVSNECSSTSCGTIGSSTPEINVAEFHDLKIAVNFTFGTLADTTFGSGGILMGPVGIAGLPSRLTTFGALNSTNIGLPSLGISGILGLGFPYPFGAMLVTDILLAEIADDPALQNLTSSARTDFLLSNLPLIAPSIPGMILNDMLERPAVAISLEREDIVPGGNIGQLTIGGLPSGVTNDSFTWSAVRLYEGIAQGGLAPPSDNPNEVFALAWEITVDKIMLNGQTLPMPNVSLDIGDIGVTALVDSGTSLMLVPSVVLDAIIRIIGIGEIGPNSTVANISCTAPVDFTVVIGGKNFSIDPIDIIVQANSTQHCDTSIFGIADPPGPGALSSFVFGVPFLKGAIAAFHYGNLTHPSVDPPSIGLMSTVPSNAKDLFSAEVNAILSSGSDFLRSSVAAPTGTFTATATNSDGVAQNPTGTAPDSVAQNPTGSPFISSSVTAPTSTSTSSNAAKLNNDLVSEGAASSSSSDDDVQKLLNYAPIVFGLLAVIILLTLVSTIVGVVSMCKRRNGLTSSGARSTVYRPLHIPPTKSQAGGAYHDAEHDSRDDEPMLD